MMILNTEMYPSLRGYPSSEHRVNRCFGKGNSKECSRRMTVLLAIGSILGRCGGVGIGLYEMRKRLLKSE